ncbi:AMME syndrome candidate protein 1 protein [Dinochytrium kinnereticum]|nr:AMME syndrome candidate protein 1 protein [Dinochytrium kinnereticum]
MDGHCEFCFDVLRGALDDTHKVPAPTFEDSEFPLFVTWNVRRKDGRYVLRGCIGTFSPISLHDGLRQYAITSAFKDSRFNPISRKELELLSCGISLLTDFEEVDDCYDWEIGFHGIWIEFQDDKSRRRTATFLPEVAKEQGWTKDETLHALLKKGGYSSEITSDTLKAIRLTRYQSLKRSITYEEYAKQLNY